jgi:dTDP-glucose pyrophosphorylase
MRNPTLVVLAAGIGSRYGGLKQTDPVGPNGELILDYSVYDALRAGFDRIVFVISHRIEKEFRQRVGKTIEQQCDTAYVFQDLGDLPAGFTVPPSRHKPWGTGHATYACRSVIDSPFAVINADDFYGRTSYSALYEHLSHAQDREGVYDYCLVGFGLENTLTEHGHVSRGVCVVDEDGTLVEIQERTQVQRFGQVVRYAEQDGRWVEIPAGSIVSLNTWGFTPSLFPELERQLVRFLESDRPDLDRAELYLPAVVDQLVREGKARVKVLPTEERWIGVTYQQDKPMVKQAIKELVRQQVYPRNLWG